MLHVVVGPPCSGKSTFVRAHAPAGVPRWDFDAMASTLAGLEPGHHDHTPDVVGVALAARRGFNGYVLDPETTLEEAWIIMANPPPGLLKAYVAAGAEIHVLDPGEAECLRRAHAEGRPPGTSEAIRGWYANPPNLDALKEAPPMRTKNTRVAVKAGPDEALEEGVFTAYASVFGNVDAYGDIVMKGAFAATLTDWEERREKGEHLPVLYGHDFADPFSNIGVVEHAEEDDHGLKVIGRLDLDNPKAAQVYRLLKSGRLSQMSFAFDVVDGEQAGENYLIRSVKLYEVSVVPIGANQATEILDVKGSTEYVTKADVLALLRDMRVAGVAVDVVDESETIVESGETTTPTTTEANALKARLALLERV